MYFINLWYSTRYNLQCIIGLLKKMIFANKIGHFELDYTLYLLC